MPESPKVSICIPSYNHARFLPAAIESALAQTYKNIEIIITDDGSTDGSLQIAKDYAARYPDLIRVLTHPGHSHRGPAATSNLAFDKATGAYWMGLSSDDLLHPSKVSEQVAFLEQHKEVGWIFCYGYYIDEQGNRLPELGLFGEDITREPDPVEYLIQTNTIPALSVLVRRDVLAEVRPEDESLVYSDWDLWVRLVARHRAAFIPHARVRFRVHSYNTSSGIPVKANVQYSLAVMMKLRELGRSSSGPLARPRIRSLLDLQSAFYFYCLQNEAQAKRHLAAAFVTDPTLQQDAKYFLRWLKQCFRTLHMLPGQLDRVGFAPWIVAQLPADLDRGFRRKVITGGGGRAFGSFAASYYHAHAHWRGRRKLIRSLCHDPLVWCERELFALHVESLVGSRFRKWLQRYLLGRPHAAANSD